MRRRDLFVIVIAMVVIAAGALVVNHYVLEKKTPLAATTATTVDPLVKAYRACVADGATIETAIAAFKAENPNLNPTESDLVSGGLGGPYLQSWASNPEFYSFSLTDGVLYLLAGTSGLLTALPSTRFRFAGPTTCRTIGL